MSFTYSTRGVNKHLNIFDNLYTKKKKKEKTRTRWPRRSDEVYVKSQESQKNYKNNEVITITSVHVCARVESCDETRTHTRTHNGNIHIRTHTVTHLIPSFCSL